MKTQFKELSDYPTDPQDPRLPFFQRFIPAFIVMERWGMDYRVFRSHPLCRYGSFIATREFENTALNPCLYLKERKGNPSKGLIRAPKDMPPFEEREFENVVYDCYKIAQYENEHPELIKNPDICPQLEDTLHPTKKRERDRLLLKESSGGNESQTRQIPAHSSKTDLKWGGITATFLNENEILFQYSGESKEKNYKQLGFENLKNGNPRKPWYYFLNASKDNGQIHYQFNDRSKVEKHVEFIRKKLKELFPGVAGDPLPHKTSCFRFNIHIKNNLSD